MPQTHAGRACEVCELGRNWLFPTKPKGGSNSQKSGNLSLFTVVEDKLQAMGMSVPPQGARPQPSSTTFRAPPARLGKGECYCTHTHIRSCTFSPSSPGAGDLGRA